MIGRPVSRRTLSDWQNAHRMVLGGETTMLPAEMAEEWRKLKAARQAYFFDRVLSDAEDPDGQEPDYIVLTDEDGTRRQHKLQDDPHSEMVRMGLTASDIDAYIAELEA